ncbi:hypothetical protein ACVWW7_004655 [Bradyrhizobium sp. LM6.9]
MARRASTTACSSRAFYGSCGPVRRCVICLKRSASGIARFGASAGGAQRGVWLRMFEALADDPDFEYLIVDSTSAPTSTPAAQKGTQNQATERSRGGLTTKIHMAARGLGCPVRFFLTVGQAGDAPQAQPLIEGLPAEVVMGDAAYDSDALRSSIAAKGAQAVIPNNPRRQSNIRSTNHSMPSVT